MLVQKDIKPQSHLLNSNHLGLLVAKSLSQEHKLKGKDVLVPLKAIHHKVRIIPSIAEVEVQLHYVNQHEFPIEAVFYFAISSAACFHGLEAQIGNRTVVGTIKEREEAKIQYEKGKSEGKTMVYTEIHPELNDTLQVNLGNIEKGDQIAIKLQYIETLKVVPQKNLFELLLPFALTPRYRSYKNKMDVPRSELGWQYFDQNQQGQEEIYSWTVDILIESHNNEIKDVISPTHKVKVQYESGKARVCFDGQEKPSKDLVVQFATKHPQLILVSSNEADDEQAPYCAYININPNEKSLSKIKNTKKFSNQNYDKGEFIFIIDRSGSMSGNRINMAKQSLILFLKSIPAGSYFNIISFGTSFRPMYTSSIKATDTSVEKTIKEVQQIEANMGGTEIYNALSFIFESILLLEDVPRNIFLLTDGDVSDVKSILALIQRFKSTVYFYTLGIGSGASSELITQSAAMGNGCSEMVNDESLINQKVIHLLKSSMAKKFYDFQLIYDKNHIEKIVPDLNQVSFIRENESLQTFVFLQKGVSETEIALNINGQEVLKHKINIHDQESIIKQNRILHKLGTFKFVKKMIQNYMQDGNPADDIYYAKQLDYPQMQKQLLDLCIKYQLLTELTAFVCEVKEMKDESKQQQDMLEKVNIPLVQSVDYANLEDRLKNLSHLDMLQTLGGQQRFASCSKQKCSSPPRSVNLCYSARPLEKKSAGCCAGGGGYDSGYQSNQLTVNKKDNSSIEEIKEKNLVMDILVGQKSAGYWQPTDYIMKVILTDPNKFLSSAPKEFADKSEVWFSIAVIIWLETFYAKFKNEWELVVLKAKKWLSSQGVDFDKSKNSLDTKLLKK